MNTSYIKFINGRKMNEAVIDVKLAFSRYTEDVIDALTKIYKNVTDNEAMFIVNYFKDKIEDSFKKDITPEECIKQLPITEKMLNN
jgi:hypothetical protein